MAWYQNTVKAIDKSMLHAVSHDSANIVQILIFIHHHLFILQQLYQIQPVTMPAGQELTQTMFIQSTNQTADAQVTQVSTDWAHPHPDPAASLSPPATCWMAHGMLSSCQHLPQPIPDNRDFKHCFLKWGTQPFLIVLGKKKNHLLRWIKKGTMFDFNIYIHASILPPPYCPYFCHSPSHQHYPDQYFFLNLFRISSFF